MQPDPLIKSFASDTEGETACMSFGMRKRCFRQLERGPWSSVRDEADVVFEGRLLID